MVTSIPHAILDNQEIGDWGEAVNPAGNKKWVVKIPRFLKEKAEEFSMKNNNWEKNHRRYFKIGGMTIQVESDLPITRTTFYHKFKTFEADGPGEDMISIEHHFGLPGLKEKDFGKKVFERSDLSIYRKTDGWVYVSTGYDQESNCLHQVSFVNPSHTRMKIYNDREDIFKKGELPLLSFFPTDLVFLTRVLADREGCLFHSSGINLSGKGLLFTGHSEAGKSTMVKMLKDRAEILCDDRIIVRRGKGGFRIHGTWNHGEIPIVSDNSAPLKAILLLEKAEENRVELINDRIQVISRLIACVIKPLGTADWWKKTFSFIENLIREVPCYCLKFDKSGKVVNLMETL